MNLIKHFLLLSFLLATQVAIGQEKTRMLPHLDSVEYLLTNQTVQIECTSGVDDLYNFKFKSAESQFNWLRRFYPTHPLPYFLLGLSNWWKIAPNIDEEQYDDPFLSYMDSSIYFAEQLFDANENNAEASFFLAAAYGFKGRLYSERKNWRKAAVAGKRALKYMEYSQKQDDLSPELLFGDGLYNFYSVWIPENYPMLKPIMWFFDKGDKKVGIEQLQTVAREAFYTRIEAQYFLMRIFAIEENKPDEALRISEYLHTSYPDNAYFHRFYARMLYQTGNYVKLERISQSILKKISTGMPGYEAISGRYASFFLASIYKITKGDLKTASEYYKQTVQFSEEIGAVESGYYLYALSYLGQFAKRKDDYDAAMQYYEKVIENASKKHPTLLEAKEFKKEYRKWEKLQKKKK